MSENDLPFELKGELGEPIPMPDDVAENLKQRGMMRLAQAGQEGDGSTHTHEDGSVHENHGWQTDFYANPMLPDQGILMVARQGDEVVPFPMTTEEIDAIGHIVGIFQEGQDAMTRQIVEMFETLGKMKGGDQ